MINIVNAVLSAASKSHFCIALSSTSSMHISNNVADTAAQIYSICGREREIIPDVIKCENDKCLLEPVSKARNWTAMKFGKCPRATDGSERSPTVMLNSLNLLLERKGESKSGQQRGLFTSYGIKEKQP